MKVQFRHAELDNGLTVIGEVNPAAASMAAGFFVRTGSRDETPDLAGVSHFLEHMMFKGTARRSALDVNREFDEMGAVYNASTSEENTIYFGAVLPEFQERLLDLICDMLRPALRGEDFDIEKNVILEEIALYEDQPRFRVYDKLMGTHFRGHPLGNSILGTAKSIRALARDDMQAYFDRRYSPGNMTLVGVGNFDFDGFLETAGRMCGRWRPEQVGRDTPRPPRSRGRKIIHDAKVLREHMALMSPAPSAQDETRYAAGLAAAILGDVTGSRLFYALVDPAIADEATTAYDPMDQAGGFMTFLSADADQAAEALEIARREMRKLVEEGPSDGEMAAAKNKIASGATLKGEQPMGRLTAVGFDWVYRKEYLPLADQIETILAVTRDEVAAVMRGCDLTAVTVVALGPLESV